MNRAQSLLAVVLVPSAFLAGCVGMLPAPTAALMSELAPTGSLRVAVFTGNPVIGTKDKASGELKGTTVTLGVRPERSPLGGLLFRGSVTFMTSPDFRDCGKAFRIAA